MMRSDSATIGMKRLSDTMATITPKKITRMGTSVDGRDSVEGVEDVPECGAAEHSREDQQHRAQDTAGGFHAFENHPRERGQRLVKVPEYLAELGHYKDGFETENESDGGEHHEDV